MDSGSGSFPLFTNTRMGPRRAVLVAAGVFVAASIFTAGMKYQEVFNTPVPCISNFHSTSHPWFADTNQEMLENNTPYNNPDADWPWASPKELIYHLVNQENTDPKFASADRQPTKIITGGYDNQLEYIVPANCYATNPNSVNGPTLYRTMR